jgi:hypothetical protein
MGRHRRLELIERIQKERKSLVVAYVLSDVPQCEGSISPEAVEELYEVLRDFKPLGKKPLDLFLFARAGDITVPWTLVGMIREMFDLFNVIVPHKAHGPATMIALGADTIIMGERGTLSPIEALVPEASFWQEHSLEAQGVGVEDVKAVMSLMESFGRVREKQKIDGLLRIMERVHPLLLGSMHKQVERIREECLRLLEKRKRRFGERRNRRIVQRLISDSFSSHHYITRTEAKETVGLKQVRTEEALEPHFWELLSLYEKEFTAGETLPAETRSDAFDPEEKLFPDQKRGFLESEKRSRVLMEDRKVQKIRETAPTIRLDPQIVLPALEIRSDLTGRDAWAFIEGWLQGNLPALIDEAFVRFRRSLPVLEYKCTSLNRRWVDS